MFRDKKSLAEVVVELDINALTVFKYYWVVNIEKDEYLGWNISRNSPKLQLESFNHLNIKAKDGGWDR